jgi:hypothetical protein
MAFEVCPDVAPETHMGSEFRPIFDAKTDRIKVLTH